MTAVDLSDERRARFTELANKCVSCGLCLPACPTFDLLAAESDGPRGRIHIMQRLMGGELDVEDARGPLDRCLGCRACETACPSDVQYGELLEIARDGGAQTPSLQVRALLSLVRHPRLLSLALRAGRPLARFVPGAAGRSGRALGGHEKISWECRNPGGPTAVVLRGCVMREAFGGAQQAAVDALGAAGYDVIAGPEQGCCGALHLHNGELATGEQMREQLLAGVPVDAILVSTAAGCGAALRAHDERVLDLSEALVRAPVPPQGSGGGPVAVFDACHLLHAQGIREAPRELLRGAGYEPVELAGNGRCCGAAGVYTFTQPELSQQLAQSRVEAIRESGARTVSCGNPGCALQLRGALLEAGLDVRVAHPAELAAEATARTY
ncbi:MAG: glycolate oxidase iron-sulfur subunit [Gaiellales bacterium]|nr:glycolate oxidase iron-sulfur subunit [Gaiellales bacterium]